MKRKTRMIHGGITGDNQTGAVSVPIYQSSTFRQDGPGEHRGFEYSRTGNPTRNAVEKLIADLEEGERGFAFASGMAAITAVMMLFRNGDHILMTDDVYGGSYRLMAKILNQFGIESSFVNTTSLDQLQGGIRPNTKAIFLETPTNPLLKITDIAAVSRLAKEANLLTIVDNTFATPYWQNPLVLGADVVVHSATKYLGGHSDVVAGLVAVKGRNLADRLHFIQNSTGGILAPNDSWLLMRGIKTLGIRMEEQEETAMKIAQYLNGHPKVKTVHYPGLKDHPGHSIQLRQARGFGSMMSFDAGSGQAAERLVKKTRYFTLAESLGAAESLISIPALMTHASIPEGRRKELGITEGLVRLSVGLEDAEDLIEDLDSALKE